MFHEMLENGLVMRTLQSEADQAAFVDFNARHNNPSEGATCQCLIRHHPKMNDDDFFIVEDEGNRQIVACLCLIPWKLNFEGILLDAAMMEMVLSHPEYRRKGLVRKLIRKFQEEVGTRGFDLTLITGIPNYYRQFGYAYALDLGTGVNLTVEKTPEFLDNETSSTGVSFRKASISDIPVLQALHAESLKGLQLFFDRDAAYWRYLLEGSQFDIRMMDDVKTGEVLGHVILKWESDILCIMESGIRSNLENRIRPEFEPGFRSDLENGNPCGLENETRDQDVAGALLHSLAEQAGRKIRIYAHPHDTVRQAAMKWGGTTRNNDQWLLKAEDQVALLAKLVPVFERRIGESHLPGFTAEMIINQFRQAIGISIVCGKITGIRSIGFVDSSMGADGGDLCIPADAFLRLLFGYRSFEQLWDAWPDTVVREESKEILGILFPKMDTHLLGLYQCQGDDPA